ncbi:helix-turn-helix transcriptional regulator [Spirillospora sp. NPDC047279]|uniref:helix-turn-helix transcriptional regulator n=1 Tax=Spirillospora sp. NPDC047279 TaxID=3155478 RepID=UPI0033CC54EE
MSRSRPPAPLREDLPEAVRVLLTELRTLKEEAGYDLRALERKTHASRSSWGRWLSGETWIPLDSVTSLAALCGADQRRLEVLWEVADQARRSPEPEPAPVEAAPQASAPAKAGSRRRTSLVIAVGVVVGATGGTALGAALKTEEPQPRSSTSVPQSVSPATVKKPVANISRNHALARARTWKPRTANRIPYDQAASYQGYRTDGSGYASMALRLPKPGPNSASLLASYCRVIPASRLEPGDLIVNATGGDGKREVMIFEKWTSRSHKSYWVFQQRRGYGTDHLIRRDVPEPASSHRACRPHNLPPGPPS